VEHATATATREYLDWGTGRNWETAIAHELPRYVDARYRTIRDRRGRAFVGLSAAATAPCCSRSTTSTTSR
jgi:S-formylglutathione hydrolase FrmB